MQLARVRNHAGEVRAAWVTGDTATVLPAKPGLATLADILHSPDPAAAAKELAAGQSPVALASLTLLAPVDRQEIWAAGVTYKRSKVAREEESAGAAQFYDKVYSAPRPELFLKGTSERVVGHGGPIRVRADATWSVPEPELTLVVSPDLRIVGYTVGNDVSSRDIEGENPLYLPQAKVYHGACAVGPVVTLAAAMPTLADVEIRLTIRRAGQMAFDGATSVSAMHRTPEELVSWLGRENQFPHGVLLLTGTGIVPPDAFNLSIGDEVSISIGGIGTLTNAVVA